MQWDCIIVNKYNVHWSQAISVAFEILLKKLQVEDTEAYHDMMRINHETFCKILQLF